MPTLSVNRHLNIQLLSYNILILKWTFNLRSMHKGIYSFMHKCICSVPSSA